MYYSHKSRLPFARLLMWVLKPVLGPMLSELNQLTRMSIQRGVHFSDVYIGKNGSLRPVDNTRRSQFFTKE